MGAGIDRRTLTVPAPLMVDPGKEILKKEYKRWEDIRLKRQKEKEEMKRYLAEFDVLITKLARLSRPKFKRRF